MRILGFDITRTKAAALPVHGWGSGGWWPIIREPYTGAWQRNDEIRIEDWLSYWPVFRCIEVISSDVAKMRLKLVAQDGNGIWTETESPAFSPVIRKPNGYQNRIQFFTSWVQSKLIHGNAYVLKQRDQRGVVTRLHVLDPSRITVLVAPDGTAFYELRGNWDLYGLAGDRFDGVDNEIVTVPAREIIHDRQDTFYHPLIGLSKMYAAGGLAQLGMSLQSNGINLFSNGSRPGGVLTAPGAISDEAAKRLKAYFDENYTGTNAGKTAVLGDGLKYEPLAFKAVDAQVVEQQKAAAEAICAVFGVPPYKLGLGPMPTANNVEALDQQYYSQCLQIFIESIELCLDEGLELPVPYGTEFELDDLLRMDTATQVKALSDAVGAGIMAPNEARRRLNLSPVKGGASPYLQQQNFSLAALDKRDKDDPFAKPEPAPAAAPANDNAVARAARKIWRMKYVRR
jgi:HK97 family phage portal protein